MVGLLSAKDYAGYADEGRRLAVDVPNVTPMDAARFIAEATPIIGDAMAAKEIYDEATSENPNWALVGALGGAAVLGLFPGIGDAAAKAVKSGARGLLDTAKRVEVDPNAMGSLLGNVRLKPKGDVGDVAKPTAAELRRQANIERFGYDPNEASASPSRAATKDAGFEKYLEQVNPGGKRIAAEDRPNLAMGDMYGMLPKKSDVVGSSNGVTFHRGADGNYYATAFNPDVGEEDVVGYITNRGDGTELAVVQEMQGKGIGGELQYLFRNENPNAPTGGLTEAGEASLAKTYQRLNQEGLLNPSPAQEISNLLASGRADEVTDEMLGKLTPNDNMELFELYQSGATGMDLPMDEASRMARAKGAGFGGDLFHGGAGGYDYLSADAGTGKTSGTGVFLSPSRLLAETYSPHRSGAVYPVSSRSSAPIVSADMQNWNNIESPVYAYDPRTMDDIEVISEMGRASTDDIAREARGLVDAIEIQDVSDRGPRAWGMTQYPPVSDIRVEYDPANIRSKFARFDPRLSNLKNLSAALASVPGGLLALQEMQKRANEEQQRQGLLQ